MIKDVKENINLFVAKEISIRQDHLPLRIPPFSIMVNNNVIPTNTSEIYQNRVSFIGTVKRYSWATTVNNINMVP